MFAPVYFTTGAQLAHWRRNRVRQSTNRLNSLYKLAQSAFGCGDWRSFKNITYQGEVSADRKLEYIRRI